MESKFIDQNVDVVSLANKGIVIGCFVGRNYNKILMETDIDRTLETKGSFTGHRSIISILHCFLLHEKYTN